MGFDIINTLKREKGITNAQLAEQAGVTLSTIDKITAGINTNPKLDTLQAICRVLGCTLNDFDDTPRRITKEAPSGLPEEALKVAKDYTALSDHGKGAVRAILEYEVKDTILKDDSTIVEPPSVIPLPKAKKRQDGFAEIKVYDQPAAAGLGNYLDEPDYHIEQYPVSVIHSKTDFGIIISGDSMEPKIHNGGTVFVQATPSIDPGKIGIFVLNREAYCKKLVVDHEKRQVRLVSINPKYEDIIIRESDDLDTVGLVLGQWTKGYQQDLFGW